MKLEDIPMPEGVANETKDMFYNIRLLLNNGKYQLSIGATSPDASTSGDQGEFRFVTEGTDYRIYIYDGVSWYKSAAFTKVV